METIYGIKRTGLINLAIVAAMAAILTIFGALFRTGYSLSSFVDKLGNDFEISVYLKSDTKPTAVAQKVSGLEHVVRVKIIPKEVSWKNLKHEIDLPNVSNPLPDTLHVKVDKPQNISSVLSQVKLIGEVEDTGYAADVAKKIQFVTHIVNEVYICF